MSLTALTMRTLFGAYNRWKRRQAAKFVRLEREIERAYLDYQRAKREKGKRK